MDTSKRRVLYLLSLKKIDHTDELGFSTRGLGLSVFLRTSVATVLVPSVRLSGGFFPNTDHKQQQSTESRKYQ